MESYMGISYGISAWYFHTFMRERVLTDNQKDGQRSASYKVLFFPFEEKKLKSKK